MPWKIKRFSWNFIGTRGILKNSSLFDNFFSDVVNSPDNLQISHKLFIYSIYNIIEYIFISFTFLAIKYLIKHIHLAKAIHFIFCKSSSRNLSCSTFFLHKKYQKMHTIRKLILRSCIKKFLKYSLYLEFWIRIREGWGNFFTRFE